MIGYEAQTSARSDTIEMNETKTNILITCVADSEEVLEEIKRLTEQRDECKLV